MKINIATFATAFAALMTSAQAAYCPPRSASPSEQRLIFAEFYQKLCTDMNATQALIDHTAEDYIQQNPIVICHSFVIPETVKFNVTLSGIDGDLAFVYLRMDIVGEPRPRAVVDLLRFNGSCIQEHWDVMQERPDNATNPLDMW
ncbi:membrane protein [Colletotrichum asianum]|uniref:Membrane protein n=1 Tax=Colletotrichum asianum TaxID=702518 RepID=A0A8H3ZZ41_9PEZI|nr:membrane protein [Colletotrichum asianum]